MTIIREFDPLVSRLRQSDTETIRNYYVPFYFSIFIIEKLIRTPFS